VTGVQTCALPISLPPGRAKLATKPSPTGSGKPVITIGMVVVAFLAANTGALPTATIRFTFRRTKSAASSGRRSGFCSANRYSMAIFFPSIQPNLLSSWRNASVRTAIPEAELESRNPMRKIFPGCCAEATAPHAVSATTIAKSPAHFRFWILDFRLSNRKLEDRIQVFSCIRFSPQSKIGNLKLLDHPIRPVQNRRRNREADLLRRFQIDEQL